MAVFGSSWQFLELARILRIIPNGEIRRAQLIKNLRRGKGGEKKMPTVNEGNKKRQAYAWMISMIMEQKEREARERLLQIEAEQPALKLVYEEYLKLYDLHIKPLMGQVDKYHANIHEKRKIEHFLQAQADHVEAVNEAQSREPTTGWPGQRSWTLPPQVEKLPYADKNSVGRKPKKEKALDESQARAYMDELKKMDPATFAALLKQVGGK